MQGVYPCRKTRSSLQPSPTTTASVCFRPLGNTAAQGNGSCSRQPSSEGLGRACGQGGGRTEGQQCIAHVQGAAYGAIHGEGEALEDVEQPIWFITPEAQGKALERTQLFLFCTPMARTKVLPGGADSFGAVLPTQRIMPHSYFSGRSVNLASSRHTFQN